MKARFIAFVALLSILGIAGQLWAQNWSGTNSTDWNNLANWGGAFPSGADVNVYTVSPNIATITADSLYTPNDIIIGSGAQINHIAGSLSTGGGWSYVGKWSNYGAYNLANTSGTGGTFTGYGEGSGNLTLGGLLNVGGTMYSWGGGYGTGTINVNTTGTLTLANNDWSGTSMVVGSCGGTGVFNLDNGTVTATNETIVIGNSDNSGMPGGNGTLNMSGGVINAPAFTLGQTGGTGNVNLVGGSVNVSGQVFVGNGNDSSINAVANGTLSMSGGQFNQTNSGQSITVGSGGGLGTLNLAGGTMNVSGDANFGNGGTGASAASAGTLNMTGGVLNVAGNLRFGAALGWFDGTAGGTGVMSLTAGTINANYVVFAANPVWNWDHASGIGAIGAGAVLNSKTWVDVGYAGQASNGAVSQLTINGTLNVNTAGGGGGLSAADAENAHGTVTINPGATVTIENNGQIAMGNVGTYSSQTGVINQNGGSVIFYSDSGTTVGGTGSLNMQGSTSSGGQYTYNLAGGTLQVPRIGVASGGWGSTTFNFNGGTLKATGNQSAFINNLSNVRIQGGGAIIDDGGYSIGISQNLTEDSASTGGGLTKLGNGMLTLSGNNSYSGGTMVNGGTLTLATGGFTGTIRGPLVINPGAYVSLVAVDALGWGGGQSVTTLSVSGGVLDNATGGNNGLVTNYVLTGGTMTSSGGGSYNLTNDYGVTTNASSATSVISSGINVRDTNNLNFNVAQGTTASGVDLLISGNITGNAITKSGAGLMELTGNSNYGGGTTVTGGVLELGNPAALGTGNLAANGGTLDMAGYSVTVPSFSGALGTITNSSGTLATLTVNQGINTTFSGQINDGAGQLALSKSGAGILTLTNTNAYSGPTTVANGVLYANVLGALSTSSAFTINGGTLDVTAAPQSVNSLTMWAGALNIQYGNLLTSTSAATFNGGTLNLSGFTAANQEVMACSSTAGSGFTATGVPNGDSLGFNVIGGQGQIDIVSNGPPTWNSSALTGSWTNSANWSSGTAPNGVGAIAVVGTATSLPVTITLDSPQTLGSLTFTNSGNNSGGYTLMDNTGTNSLTMSNTGSTAQINVTSGTHAIAASVMIAGGNLAVSASNNGQLTISGNILDDSNSGSIPANVRSLTLTSADGTGELVLGGTNSYFGGTIVQSGTLILTNNEALAGGSSLTIGDASAFAGGPGGARSDAAGSAVVVLGSGPNEATALPSITPVPEPGTLVLVVASVVAGLATWRRRRNRGN